MVAGDFSIEWPAWGTAAGRGRSNSRQEGCRGRRSAVVARQRRPRPAGAGATVCGCPASRRRCRTERPGRRPSRRRDSRRWPATPQAQPRHPRRRSTDPRRAPAQAGPPKRRSDVSAGHRAAPAAAGGATGAPTAPRQRPDSARNRYRPPNGAEREVRAARRRGGLSQRLMACLHACSAVTPSAAVAVTSGTSAAAAKRPAGGVRDPLAGRVPEQRLRASRPGREEANGSLSATAAARVAANGGELLSALPRPARKPAGCARTVLPARNRPQSRSEAPAERHTTTVGRS